MLTTAMIKLDSMEEWCRKYCKVNIKAQVRVNLKLASQTELVLFATLQYHWYQNMFQVYILYAFKKSSSISSCDYKIETLKYYL